MTTRACRHPASRAVTDELLAELRSGRWRPRVWGRFLGRAAGRSWAAAHQRPRAVAEVTVLHAALVVLRRWSTSGAGDRGHRRRSGASWVTISWALSITHLGMLESGRSLGVANVVTLVRANLPPIATAVRPGDGRSQQALAQQARVLAAAALASDLLDGRLARWRDAVTPFGRYADSFADAAFWTWFALRHEPDRRVRLLALGAWAFPVLAVTVISVARGRMIDAPRPALARPAAVMQIMLAARACAPSSACSSKSNSRPQVPRLVRSAVVVTCGDALAGPDNSPGWGGTDNSGGLVRSAHDIAAGQEAAWSLLV